MTWKNGAEHDGNGRAWRRMLATASDEGDLRCPIRSGMTWKNGAEHDGNGRAWRRMLAPASDEGI